MAGMKQKRYWVIQRVERSVEMNSQPGKAIRVNPAGGCIGVMFVYRTKADAVRANGGSRKDVVCYWQIVD